VRRGEEEDVFEVDDDDKDDYDEYDDDDDDDVNNDSHLMLGADTAQMSKRRKRLRMWEGGRKKMCLRKNVLSSDSCHITIITHTANTRENVE
jgi:hypothetical protein